MSRENTAKNVRRLSDKFVSAVNLFRYAVTESVLLRVLRLRYAREYRRHVGEQPLVSVYIPTFNRREILMERAVPSVLSQTYKNFELIIVGDHCTDGTKTAISAVKDKRVRFLNLPTRTKRYADRIENHWFAGGVTPANAALKLIKGKWIARIDDDDIWTADHIEKLMRYACENDFEFVSAQYEEERFGKRSVVDGVRAKNTYFTRKPIPANDHSVKLGSPSTFFYRTYLRYFRHNINCWRKSWNRDNNIDLMLRMFNAGVRMGFLDHVVAYVLPRPGESTVGLEAYKLSEKDKLEHFKFDE